MTDYTGLLNAHGIVNDGWARWNDLALSTFAEALDIQDQLQSFDIEPFDFTVNFQPPEDLLKPFNAPEKPRAPEIGDYKVVKVVPLELKIPEVPDFPDPPGDAPKFDVRPNFGQSPTPLTAQNLQPPGEPQFDEIDMPDGPPPFEMPPLPELLTVRTDMRAPKLNEHTFEHDRPDLEGEPPDTFIDFTEEEYESQLLDETRNEILRMLETGTGMPVLVEQLLLDSARERDSVEANRAVHEAVERWTARGFSLPSGVLNKEVAKVRQDNSNRVSEMNREVFIQRRKEELENFRFAIAQGIALENILIQKHLNVMARAFALAQAVADLEYREFEARIAIFNARVQAYRTDVEVYRGLIEAESQKLEQFRLELQAEALKGEINRDRVALYNAQLEAITTLISVFTAQIEAARAQVQKQQVEAQVYSTQIQAYAQKIEAKTAEFRGWATKVQGELGKVQAFEAETRAFLGKVQAYDSEIRANLAEPQIELSIRELEVREFLARLEHRKQDIEKEVARWQAESTLYNAEGNVYQTHGQIAANQAAASDRQFLSKLRESELFANSQVQNWTMKIEQADNIARVLVGALDSAGRGKSQLAAGAMSAVSLSAGISASAGEGWNRSATFEGEGKPRWG